MLKENLISNEQNGDLKKIALYFVFLITNFGHNGNQNYVRPMREKNKKRDKLFKYVMIGVKVVVYSISWVMVLIWDAYEYGMVFYGLILGVYLMKYYSNYSCLNYFYRENFKKL